MVPVFKNVGERSTAKNYCPVSLLSVYSKVFEKLVNNGIDDHLEKYGLFSKFQYGFRSSRSTADICAVRSDRIAGVFNSSVVLRFSFLCIFLVAWNICVYFIATISLTLVSVTLNFDAITFKIRKGLKLRSKNYIFSIHMKVSNMILKAKVASLTVS